jgi:membrane-bound inhibitor of C-type lysozyme
MTRKLFQTRRLWIISAACLFLTALAAPVPAKPGEDELFLSFGGKDYILTRDESVSGDKYTAKGDPATAFWSDGKRAVLTVGGQERTRYVLLRDLPDDDGLILTADGENYKMKQAVSASGAKYEAVDDPTTVFWSKGASAFLTVKGKDYPGYETWAPNGVICLTDSADIQEPKTP